MRTFLCKTCNLKFEAEGEKIEWIDPIYGPCSKFTSSCPNDGEECEEYRPLKNSKNELHSGPSCCPGGCCCGR